MAYVYRGEEPFQNWLNDRMRERQHGFVDAGVVIDRPLKMFGQRWVIQFINNSNLVCNFDNKSEPAVEMFRTTRFEMRGWRIINAGSRQETAIRIFSDDRNQRGYSQIDTLFVQGFETAVAIEGDNLEQSTIREFTTDNCWRSIHINSPSMDMLTVEKFRFRRMKEEKLSTLPVIDVVKGGAIRFYDGNISHIRTTAPYIRLHGGTHVLRDVWVEVDPEHPTMPIEILQALGRNNTILDGFTCSPDAKSTDEVSARFRRVVNLMGNCSFPGHIVFDTKRPPLGVDGCRVGGELRTQ